MVKNNIFKLDKNELERAKELHEKSIFVNATDSTFAEVWDEEYYDQLLKSGITLTQLEIQGWNFNQSLEYFTNYIKSLNNVGMDKFILARRTEDIIRAKKEGKIALFFGTQHGAIIETDEECGVRESGARALETLHLLGLRTFILCYNLRNYIADGCNEITDSGLSAFGYEVVKKCNELGIIIDLSHVGRKSSLETIEASKDPVIFSHSNAIGVYRNRRNLYDDQIKAIGEKNGIIGVTAFGPMVKLLTSNDDKAYLEDMLDHFDYVIDRIGAKYVGIGLDVGWKRTMGEAGHHLMSLAFSANEMLLDSGAYTYSLHNWYVEELKAASNWPKITEGLVARGYSDDEILKILGGNFMRVFKVVWDK